MTSVIGEPRLRDLERISEFSKYFLELVDSEITGTLIVAIDDDTRAGILFQNGGVADLDPGADESILERALLASGQVSEKDLRKAAKKTSRADMTPAQWILGRGAVDEELLLSKISEIFTEEASLIFDSPLEAYEFFEHEPEQRVEGFNSELSDLFDLFFDGEDLFLEAMRRLDGWDVARDLQSDLLDIYYATPGGMRYYSDPEFFEREVKLISVVDGHLDLEEVIEKVDLPELEALQIIRALARNDEIQPINPVQMFQLGVDTMERREFDKASRVFERAMERGLDDFDIQYKLAECHASAGNSEKATRLFKEFAEKCTDQHRLNGAIHSLRRVLDIRPSDVDAHRELVELLIRNNQEDEAVALAVKLSERLESAGDPEAALAELTRLREREIETPHLSRAISGLARGLGTEDELERESSAPESQADDEDSLEAYERRFAEGNDGVDVRLKLVSLHLDRGNEDLALKHIDGLLGTRNEAKIEDASTVESLHKTRQRLSPGHSVSSRWLVDHHLKSGHVTEAVAVLRAYIDRMERDGNDFLLVDARKRLVALDTGFEARWELADLYLRLSRPHDAVEEIEEISRIAAKESDEATSQKAWDRLAEMAPFHREGLFRLGVHLAGAGDTQGALQRLDIVARLDICQGRLDAAQETLAKIREIVPDDPEIPYLLAIAQLKRGDKKQGLALLKEATQFFFKSKDLGRARKAIEQAFCEGPGKEEKEEIAELKRKLESMEKNLEGRPASPADAPASSSRGDSIPLSKRPTRGKLESVPFEGRRPVLKGTVNAITAKLKTLKAGGGRRPADRGKIVVGGLKNISSTLKDMQGGGEAGGAPSSDVKPSKVVSRPATTKKSKLGGAASRLKSLAAAAGASPKANASPASPPADATSGSAAEGGNVMAEAIKATTTGEGIKVKRKLGGAAARLAKLKAMSIAAAGASGADDVAEPAAPQDPAEPGEPAQAGTTPDDLPVTENSQIPGNSEPSEATENTEDATKVPETAEPLDAPAESTTSGALEPFEPPEICENAEIPEELEIPDEPSGGASTPAD